MTMTDMTRDIHKEKAIETLFTKFNLFPLVDSFLGTEDIQLRYLRADLIFQIFRLLYEYKQGNIKDICAWLRSYSHLLEIAYDEDNTILLYVIDYLSDHIRLDRAKITLDTD